MFVNPGYSCFLSLPLHARYLIRKRRIFLSSQTLHSREPYQSPTAAHHAPIFSPTRNSASAQSRARKLGYQPPRARSAIRPIEQLEHKKSKINWFRTLICSILLLALASQSRIETYNSFFTRNTADDPYPLKTIRPIHPSI